MKRFKFKGFISLIVVLLITISIFPIKVNANDSKYMDKYDPREKGLVTSVKDQGKWGVCWDFAGIGALESNLLKNGYGEYDFSEEHVRWWATFNNEGYGWNRKSNDGAATQVIPGYLTSGQGIKLEKDIPYQDFYGAEKPENMDTAKSIFNVTDIVYVNNDRDSVKESILNYGAVTTTLYFSTLYLNYETSAYRCTSNILSANHNVVIVGWDDNYPKENFNERYRPQSNGAWLIKNSSGESYSEKGYLWVSYEDNYILSESSNKLNYAIKNVKNYDENNKIYQYDEYGASGVFSLSYSDTKEPIKDLTYVNVYDFSEEYEELDSIMIMTKAKGSKYKLYYSYVIGEEPVLNESTMILLDEGTVDFSGYITFDFQDFKLPEGKGAIVVRIDNSENNQVASIGVEKDISYVSGELAYKGKANIGESYVVLNDSIIDVNKLFTDSPRNFTIKAITKKSKDTSLSSININDIQGLETLDDKTYKIELPYKYRNEKCSLKIITNNNYSKVISIDSNKYNSNEVEEFIVAPDEGEISNKVITVQAADGTVNFYNLQIAITNNVKSSDDLIKYFENMNYEKEDDFLLLSKYYEALDNVEKEVVPENIVNYISQGKDRLMMTYHESKGVKINNIPWQVQINVENIKEDATKFKEINDLIGNNKIISLYKGSLIDNYTKLPYHIENEIEISIPFKDNEKYNDIKIIQIDEEGKVSFINPVINIDNVTFKTKSTSYFGIICTKDIKEGNDINDNNDISNVTIEDDKEVINIIDNTISGSIVNSSDDTSIKFYVIIATISFISVILMIKYNKKKKR